MRLIDDLTPPPNDAGGSAADAVESLVSELADDYLARLDRGERPDVEEYARRHPAVAGVLRQVLPAVGLIRDLPPSELGLTSPGATEDVEPCGRAPWATTGSWPSSAGAGWGSCTRRCRSRSAGASR